MRKIIFPFLIIGLLSLWTNSYAQWNISPGCWAYGGSNTDIGYSGVEVGSLFMIGATTISFGFGEDDAYIVCIVDDKKALIKSELIFTGSEP